MKGSVGFLVCLLVSISEPLLTKDSHATPGPLVEVEEFTQIDDKLLLPITNHERRIRFNPELPVNCPASCPTNTLTVGDECFRYETKRLTWEAASIDCVEQGGYLAIPDLSYASFALDMSHIHSNIMGISRVWIGAYDHDSSVVWKWLNGTGLSLKDPSWYKGHPGVYNFNNCAQIYTFKRGLLEIVKENCNTSRGYLCEFQKIQSIQKFSNAIAPQVVPLSRMPDYTRH